MINYPHRQIEVQAAACIVNHARKSAQSGRHKRSKKTYVDDDLRSKPFLAFLC